MQKFQICILISLQQHKLTNTSFLVIFLPAFFAFVTVLIGRSRTCFAGRVTFCKKRSEFDFKPASH